MCARSHTGGLTNERGACCRTSSLSPLTIASVQSRTELNRSAIAVWGGLSTLTTEDRTGHFAHVDPERRYISAGRCQRRRRAERATSPPATQDRRGPCRRSGPRRLTPAARAAPDRMHLVARDRPSGRDVMHAHRARGWVGARPATLAVGCLRGGWWVVVGHALTLTPAVRRRSAQEKDVSAITRPSATASLRAR